MKINTIVGLISLTILSACSQGSSGGKDGIDGKDGADGIDGKDGQGGLQEIYDRTQEIYSLNRQSIYRISVTCDNTVVSYGSGFRLSNTEVATNAHVTNYDCGNGVNKSFQLEYVDNDIDTVVPGNSTIVYDYLESSEYDLAKIYVPVEFQGSPVTMTTVPFGQRIETGQYTVSLSFPLGFVDMFTLIGQVSANNACFFDKYNCDFPYDFIVTNDIDHGSSGSPIFDMVTGEVIGVVSAGIDNINSNPVYVIDSYKLGSF